jgi:hypothetical protein
MLPHHAETVQRTTDHFAAQPGVIGLLLGGSLAHGYATADSDVDVMIVVSDADHQRRIEAGTTTFFSRELCTYPEGYVDGKYTSLGYLDQVEDHGSEPARFAFQDARVLFSRDASLVGRLQGIARYPVEEKAARLWRFQAQFEAWYWYCSQALAKNNLTLLRTAVSKLVLFGGRIVLAHNETLYPFHKWFLRVLSGVPHQPPGLMAQIQALALAPDRETIDQFAITIRGFRPWEISHATWPAQFMADSENNWLNHPAPVDDI